MKKIFLVEDHPLVRQGYTRLIGREADLEVCGEATSVQEALEKIPVAAPDLVIVDLSLQGSSGGMELVELLHARQPDLLLLVISGYEASVLADRALGAGARGYLAKHHAAEALVEAIRQVLGGQRYLSD